MDHLPRVANPFFPPLQVPCLAHGEYQRCSGTFQDYPKQRGWDIYLLLQGIFSQHSVEATGAFLQDWLFFGLLQQVFGNRFTKETFLDWDAQSNQTVITTANLVPSLNARFQDHLDLPPEGKAQAIADLFRIEKALSTLSFFCNMAVAYEGENSALSRAQPQWPLSLAVDLSIRVLGQLVTTAVRTASMPLRRHIVPPFTFPGGNFTVARMRQGDWCPSDIAMVSEYMSATALYYASSLRRFQLHQDHSNCTSQLCFATQLDTRTYQTAHSVGGCICDHISAPVSELIPIIANKGIPLITIMIAKSGDPILRISPYRYGKHYIAFSHVWSDGLGNLQQNSLPRCQILRLKALVDELTWSQNRIWDDLNKVHLGKYWNRLQGRTVPFWLDTLCIPVGSLYQKFRSMAISLMYKTYVSARHVFVLDSELQRTPTPPDMNEVFLRVSISGWMRRLWTLQEGVLGRSLQVKFQDGIVDLVRENNAEVNPKPKPSRKDKVLLWKHENGFPSPYRDCRNFYWQNRSLRFTIVEKRERKLIGTTNIIRHYTPKHILQRDRECAAILEAFVSSNYRSSLRKADEHLCLSGLLGWDTNCLHGVAAEERMKTLLGKQAYFPQGILFIAGPRMLEKGWRWALQSFGNNGSEQLVTHLNGSDSRPARLCVKGLIVQYPGFIMPSSNQPLYFDDFLVKVALSEAFPSVLCRVRIHLPDRYRKTRIFPTSVHEDPGTRSSLGIIFYPVGVMAPFVPMSAVLVEMDEEPKENASSELEGVLACVHLQLATIEWLDYDDGSPIWADVHVASTEAYVLKQWCVG
ncbi:MAG: hypothetical protein Q9172_003049 [Xanthocarpia lactea]